MDSSMPDFSMLHYLSEFAEIHFHWVSDAINHLTLCCPLLLPSIFLSIRVFSNELVLPIRWLKYWNFSISPSNEYSGWISFRIDWFDLLAVQRTLKSLLQHHNSKISILRCLVFYMVQLSYQYMTTGKTVALTIWISVGKVMSLLFNMLSDPAHLWMAPRVKRLSHPLPEVGHSRRYLQNNGLLLYFLNFSRSLFYKRTWHPDPDKMVILRH